MSTKPFDNALVAVWLKLLTNDEKISLLAGQNMWETASVDRLGIPSLKTTDGPAGVRGQTWFGGSKSSFIPCGISMGATFDPDLIEKLGEILGSETMAKNAHILLAPTMNMSRSPFGGRNFENFGEDPFLTGKIATSEILGIQGQGVGACAKHYVGNEQESRRFNIDEQIDERTLREVYLRPFQMTLKAQPWSMMASYNKVNGEHVDMSQFLLKKVLREEWGFQGLVMSDWGGTNDTVQSLKAGLDLEMPGPPVKRGSLVASAINEGSISLADVDECVRNVLKTVCKAGLKHTLPEIVQQELASSVDVIPPTNSTTAVGAKGEHTLDLPEHRALMRQAGTGGIVLLKNNGILPLNAKEIKKLAIIGPNAKKPTAGGSGSAALNPYYISIPYDAIEKAARQINPDIEISYAQGILTHRLMPLLGNISTPDGLSEGVQLDFFHGYDLEGDVVETKPWSSSFIFFMSDNDVPQKLKGKEYSIRLSGLYKPATTGLYQFGLSNIGKAKFYIDGKLIIDNTSWTKAGGTMMNCGSEEIVSAVQLEMGTSYHIVIDYAATPPPFKAHDNTLFPFLAGIRLGALPPIDEESMFQEAVQSAKAADRVIYIGGLNNDWEKEGTDRVTLDLPRRSNELIRAILEANSNTVIVNQSACAVNLAPFADNEKAAAIVQAWYQGQECGNAIADVVLGSANPSGKLPITFPRKIDDHGTFQCFPGDVDNDHAKYEEGVLIGYRWFDSHNLKPLYEFGFGLSYTTFELSNIHIRGQIGKSQSAVVVTTVKNTGNVEGAEVVQVYISSSQVVADKGLPRVMKALCGFQKVSLQPGETKDVEIKLKAEAVEWYDVEKGQWRVDDGIYDVHVGCSSRDIRAVEKLQVQM